MDVFDDLDRLADELSQEGTARPPATEPAADGSLSAPSIPETPRDSAMARTTPCFTE